jgi:hypothetical protein
MSVTNVLSRAAPAFIVTLFAFGLTVTVAIAANQFEGTWMTQDTKGKSFHITLSPNGNAKGERQDEGLTGTWKAEGDSVVINWDSGWVTKLTKQGDKFTKQTFAKGQEGGTPSHTADAQKM